jgi:hypothetical protein
MAGFEYVELAAIAGMAEHIKIGDDTQRIKDCWRSTASP